MLRDYTDYATYNQSTQGHLNADGSVLRQAALSGAAVAQLPAERAFRLPALPALLGVNQKSRALTRLGVDAELTAVSFADFLGEAIMARRAMVATVRLRPWKC